MRVDEVLDIEGFLASNVRFLLHLLLDQEHLGDVCHLDALPSRARELLTLEQGGQVDELGAVQLVAEVEDGSTGILELEPNVGSYIALLDHVFEFGREVGREAHDEVLLNGQGLLGIAVELPVPADAALILRCWSPSAVAAASASSTAANLELDLGSWSSELVVVRGIILLLALAAWTTWS